MAARTESQPRGTVDYDLMLKRLEAALGDEKGRERIRHLVEKNSVWLQLSPEQAVKWAQIAAAVGKVDVARTVLEHVTNQHPNCVSAWKVRCELLEAGTPPREEKKEKDERDQLGTPFDTYRWRQSAIEKYMSIFRGREDCFARQWVDREKGTAGYSPVRRPMTAQDVWDHLQGRRTYGIYLLQKDSRVRIGVIDADCSLLRAGTSLSAEQRKQIKQEALYILTRLPEIAAEFGLTCISEFSGSKGYHFWFPVDKPILAQKMRRVLTTLAKKITRDVTLFSFEVFPKQDRLAGKGLGNLVKLPLGIHRLTGKPSLFVVEKKRELDAQLAVLDRVKINSSELFDADIEAEKCTVVTHPEYSSWQKHYPELATLMENCVVLAHLITRCRAGEVLTAREEKVLFGTISFLRRGRTLMHYLLKNLPDYNPYLVDYKLSRVRGTPLGCRTIHRLLDVVGDMCLFDHPEPYAHPLLHLRDREELISRESVKAERVENLQGAIELLKTAIEAVERFLPGGGGRTS